MKKVKYFFDTEFIEDGKAIDLVSIGIVCEDGREYYAEVSDVDLTRANEFVKKNVIPHLWSHQKDKSEFNRWSRDGGKGGLLTRSEIRRDIQDFTYPNHGNPEFWTWYGAYDWICMCQLFGSMTDLPRHFDMFTMDLRQVQQEMENWWQPPRHEVVHNALEDAKWTKEMHDGLMEMKGLRDVTYSGELRIPEDPFLTSDQSALILRHVDSPEHPSTLTLRPC